MDSPTIPRPLKRLPRPPRLDGELHEQLRDVADVRAWTASRAGWIVEGCYGDIVEALLPACTELHFLNPGVAACVRNCRARPWEPHKFASADDQERMLAPLIAWVGEYELRDDEFGLRRHRAIFDGFAGTKHEHAEP